MHVIEIKHLTKRYGGFTAVRDLSFTIDGSGVYGFLGPNGAGKTTTMNVMTGCLSPSEGTVVINGFDILEEPREAKSQMGYLPEQPPLYMAETPREYLTFVGEAKGLKGTELARQIEQVIAKTGLGAMSNRLISSLSKGYKQRVGIAQALLGNPEIIILDEPTVGLDPIQIIEIRELITQLGMTHTVILSSHILSEVQTLCAQILIISSGKLVCFDTPQNLEKTLAGRRGIRLIAHADATEARAALEPVEGLASVECRAAGESYTAVEIGLEGDDVYDVCTAIFFAFASAGLPIVEMMPQKSSLEEVFLELTDRDTNDSASESAGESASGNTNENTSEAPRTNVDAQPAPHTNLLPDEQMTQPESDTTHATEEDIERAFFFAEDTKEANA